LHCGAAARKSGRLRMFAAGTAAGRSVWLMRDQSAHPYPLAHVFGGTTTARPHETARGHRRRSQPMTRRSARAAVISARVSARR
jgi:hypothetical protein